jgi:hypothetical protein
MKILLVAVAFVFIATQAQAQYDKGGFIWAKCADQPACTKCLERKKTMRICVKTLKEWKDPAR